MRTTHSLLMRVAQGGSNITSSCTGIRSDCWLVFEKRNFLDSGAARTTLALTTCRLLKKIFEMTVGKQIIGWYLGLEGGKGAFRGTAQINC